MAYVCFRPTADIMVHSRVHFLRFWSSLLPLRGKSADFRKLHSAPLVSVTIGFNVFRLIKQLLPTAQLFDIGVARHPHEAVLVRDIVDSDLRPFLGPPIRNVHKGLETDSVQFDAGVERF